MAKKIDVSTVTAPEGVTVRRLKSYTSWTKGSKSVCLRGRKVRITSAGVKEVSKRLKMDPKEVSADVAKKSHLGRVRSEFAVTTAAEVEKVLKASYR